MRAGRVAAPVLLLLGLTGCATPVAEQLSSLESAAVCCTSMSEFKYVPLTREDEREVKLTAESSVFVFESGKSYFAAYELPGWNGAPYQIRAESLTAHARGGFLTPSALMLDAGFKVTRRFNVGAGPTTRPHVLHVFVNEANANERYVVLFTGKLASPEGVDTLTANPIMVPVGTVMVPMGASESRVSVPYAPTGMLRLKVSPYQPLKPGQAAER